MSFYHKDPIENETPLSILKFTITNFHIKITRRTIHLSDQFKLSQIKKRQISNSPYKLIFSSNGETILEAWRSVAKR